MNGTEKKTFVEKKRTSSPKRLAIKKSSAWSYLFAKLLFKDVMLPPLRFSNPLSHQALTIKNFSFLFLFHKVEVSFSFTKLLRSL